MTASLFIILLVLGSTTGLVEKPSNTVDYVGQDITLRCRGTSSDGTLVWQKSRPSQPTMFDNLSPPKYSAVYSSSTFVSVLTISSLASSDAGTYVCRPGINLNTGAYAQVVVLDAQPTISSSPALNQLASGDSVTTTSSVTVHSPVNYRPRFTWQASGVSLTASDSMSNSVLSSVFTETVTCDSNGRQYLVVVNFPTFDTSTLPDSSWDHHRHPPTYSEILTSDTMSVFCAATGVDISPKTDISPSGTITCEALPATQVGSPITYTVTATAYGASDSVNTNQYTLPSYSEGVQFTLECRVMQTWNTRTFTKAQSWNLQVNSGSSAGRPQLLTSLATAIFGLHALLATFKPIW